MEKIPLTAPENAITPAPACGITAPTRAAVKSIELRFVIRYYRSVSIEQPPTWLPVAHPATGISHRRLRRVRTKDANRRKNPPSAG
jgi:hypothetical protein